MQIVGEFEQEIDRKQLLRFEDSLFLPHQFRPRIGIVDPRTARQQAQHPVLRDPSRARSRAPEQGFHAGASRIEQIAAVLHCAERHNERQQRCIRFVRRNAPLTAENLPKPGQPLYHPERVLAE